MWRSCRLRFYLADAETELILFVKVSDSGEVPLDSTVLVTVTITSLPLPVFRSDSVQIFLKESEIIGSEVIKVWECVAIYFTIN